MTEEEKKDFVVKDRRIFSQERREAEESDVKQEPQKEDKPPQEKSEEKHEPKPDSEKKSDYKLPEINFPTFIISLSSSVYVQLGFMEDPSTGKREKNLPLAKQTIDIMGMLEEKTRGNLTTEEENMLKNILYDLRLLYVREKE